MNDLNDIWLTQSGPMLGAADITLGGHRLPAWEVALLAGAALAALGLLVWALAFRERPQHSSRRTLEPDAGSDDAESRHHHHHRRRRHRRRPGSFKQRNPTLQETGGLPPLRPEDEPPRF